MTRPPVLDPADFLARFEMAARPQGFRQEKFGEASGYPLIAWTRRSPGVRPRVYLSAGIHGDEPAPPFALLRLLESGALDERCTWFVCPLLNAGGFLAHTRENAAGIDLNRDYKDARSVEISAHVAWLRRQPRFDLVICLHEDWEASGFYLYELNVAGQPTLADIMVGAVRPLCPIESATVIDGRDSAEPGIIRPVSDPLLRETWPEAIYLRHFHSTLTYTLESPSALPMEQRIATLVAATKAGLDAFW